MALSYPVHTEVLGNGLRVVVSEDHADPSVTVMVAYDVGSANDARGLLGLAHLFEHNMFKGSRDVGPGEHARLMAACGADSTAATSYDMTVYYQRLPVGAMGLAMWLEANRMATLGESLTPERLANQRDVIGQEWHQRYSVPFGSFGLRLQSLPFPAAHPYHPPLIGLLDHLAAATVADLRAFLSRWYTPRNAALIVAGDVTVKEALAEADRYFGMIPAGPDPARAPVPVLGPADAQARDAQFEEVPYPVTGLSWRLPPNSMDDPEVIACDLALRILADGPASRAHQVLARDAQLAQGTSAQAAPRRGNSLGFITVPGMPGTGAGEVEHALFRELEALAADGPGADELAVARAAAERQVLDSLAGGFGRATNLAGFALLFGDAALLNGHPERYAAVTAGQVRDAAATWLAPGSAAVITTSPAPALQEQN